MRGLAARFVLLAAIGACGSGTGGSGGLDRSRKLIDLSAVERQRLCDRAPRPSGSDGGVVMCPGGGSSSVINPPSICLTYLQNLNPSCVATVAQSEDCTRALADHACDIATAYSTDACMATVGCDTTSCRNYCDGRCGAEGTAGNSACRTACFDATSGTSQPCRICQVASGAGSCDAMTFATPDSAECRTACGAAD